ncbi:hypothetical protein BaRGS_00022368 [Batillaria attramentaria]|uniref:Fucosyltransferase n=1 Tax=Batillaria attramentaria TaxID=370345 RepID=A0ABD0KH27_9CAEN
MAEVALHTAHGCFRWNKRMLILLVVTALGLVTLFLQQHALHRTPVSLPEQDYISGGNLCKAADRSVSLRDLSKNISSVKASEHGGCTKVVLMHSFPYWYGLKPESKVFDGCSNPCLLLLESERTSEADCVVFFTSYSKATSTPARRSGSVWVYFAVESPIHSANEVFGQAAWHGQINWTMTYRRDSDIYFGYGDLSKRPVPSPRQDLVQVYRKKTKMVAWFVSNCNTPSKREDFVAALKNFIPVDVYGKCGTLQCGMQGNATCMNMLSNDYYFYLSFENSLCVDYITEKLYRTIEMVDIVPVVRGGANYSALLPKNSYIDVSEFSSVKALADFLKDLASDEVSYLRYLDWKRDWKVIEPMPLPFCELCRRVHSQRQWAKVYDNVDTWWRKDMCNAPPPVILS